ncbi:MAG: hypothetical protein ACE5J0_00695 [Candidatus Paceibacterales bacterium]
MKKILSNLIVMSVLAAVLVPGVASAQPAQTCTLAHTIAGCPAAGVACNLETDPGCALCCVLDAVYTVTDWIFLFLIAVVALLVIWGGFTIATAAGAPEKVESGRNYILYAMIGLAVALLSKAIPALVKTLVRVA